MKAEHKALRFPISKGWLLTARAFSIFMSVGVLWLAYALVTKTNGWSPAKVLGFVVCILVSQVVLAWAIRAKRYALEILPDRIRYIGSFFDREIELKDIDGYRMYAHQGVHNLLILSKDMSKGKIGTALCYENQQELLQWLQANLDDLDIKEEQKDMKAAEEDPWLGKNKAERASGLKTIKRLALSINILGIAVTVWGMAYPSPYDMALFALIATPVLAILVVLLSGGRIKIGRSPNANNAFTACWLGTANAYFWHKCSRISSPISLTEELTVLWRESIGRDVLFRFTVNSLELVKIVNLQVQFTTKRLIKIFIWIEIYEQLIPTKIFR